MIAPFCFNLDITVASYTGIKSCSILDAHVVLIPFVEILSLIAILIPSIDDNEHALLSVSLDD